MDLHKSRTKWNKKLKNWEKKRDSQATLYYVIIFSFKVNKKKVVVATNQMVHANIYSKFVEIPLNILSECLDHKRSMFVLHNFIMTADLKEKCW